MNKRTLAKLLALNRIQYGMGLVLTPERNAKVWVGGRAARQGPNKLLAQALGVRDLVMGAGALRSIGDADAARAWFAALAVADGVDVVVTARADGIPAASRIATLAIAAASTAIGALYAAAPE
jgi:hypothetical protein